MQWLWDFLDGKKTYIAVIGWVVVSLLHDYGTLDDTAYQYLITIILGWAGVGITHKINKYLDAIKCK